MSTVPNFDLNLLPILLALHDARSVSMAAQQLGMSQPGVSTALAKLRTAFDDPLFVRTSRGMEPTPRAMALIPAARDVLARVQQGILDTGAFDDDRYWIVDVSYAKADPADLLMTIDVTNAGPDAATLHVLPTAWFRNTWSWDEGAPKPAMAARAGAAFAMRGVLERGGHLGMLIDQHFTRGVVVSFLGRPANRAQHRCVGGGGDRPPPGQPVSQLGVRQLHEFLKGVQLRVGEEGDSRPHEAAHEQVVLVGAAVGGAEQDAAAARVERRGGFI